MPRTRPQLLSLSATRIREQNRRTLTWAGMLRALNRATVPDRELIITAIKSGNVRQIGTLITTQLNKVNQLDSTTEATAILTDDNVSLTELDRIL